MKRLAVAAALLVMSMGPAWGGEVTGNLLHEQCQSNRGCMFFVAGYAYGYRAREEIEEVIAKDMKQPVVRRQFCLGNSLIPQWTDVVKQFLEKHPAKRHENARWLVLEALIEAFPCKKSP